MVAPTVTVAFFRVKVVTPEVARIARSLSAISADELKIQRTRPVSVATSTVAPDSRLASSSTEKNLPERVVKSCGTLLISVIVVCY